MGHHNVFRYIRGPFIEPKAYIFKFVGPHCFCFHEVSVDDLQLADWKDPRTTIFKMAAGETVQIEICEAHDGLFEFCVSQRPSFLLNLDNQQFAKVADTFKTAAASSVTTCYNSQCAQQYNEQCPPGTRPVCQGSQLNCVDDEYRSWRG